MSQSSRTESEPDESLDAQDAVDFMDVGQASQSVLLPLHEAITILQNLDICAIESDEDLHEPISHASSTIIWHLDQITAHSTDGSDAEYTRLVLQTLLDPQLLSLLFDYRAIFHRIASRSAGLSSTVVCWADVVLMKLAQATVTAAGTLFGIDTTSQQEPEFVRLQREHDMLRAAVQLPEKWSSVLPLLSSEHVSPASFRLALSLVFGVYVMLPQLPDVSLTTSREELSTLQRVVHSFLKRTAAKRDQGIEIDVLNSNVQERTTYSMIVSLYAVADHSGASLDLSSMPQSRLTLLDMIQAVLRPNPSLSPNVILAPLLAVDLPVIILTKWEATLPWVWATWEDPRSYNSDLTLHLTSTWLYNLETPLDDVTSEHSVHYWDDHLVRALKRNPSSALTMLARILLSALGVIKEGSSPSPELLDVLLKTCWSIHHLLQTLEVDHASMATLLTIICTLFVSLSDSEVEVSVKDLIIEILSLSTSGLVGVVEGISEPKSRIPAGLGRKLEIATRKAQDEMYRETPTFIDLRIVRQLIHFLTLIWTSGASLTTMSPPLRSFLSGHLDWLAEAEIGSMAWQMLSDALIGLAAVLAVTKRPEDYGVNAQEKQQLEQLVGNLFWVAEPHDLALASALALYLNTATRQRWTDQTICMDAWNYFRDVLLLILTRDFEGLDEPLALLVAPSICSALLQLAQHAEARTFYCCASSPWTTSMLSSLRKFLDHQGGDGYSSILKERINSTAQLLSEILEGPPGVRSPELPAAGPPKYSVTESVFFWLRSLPCLVLSVN